MDMQLVVKTFRGDLNKKIMKTKVLWRPSWNSRWPPEIQIWTCVHWICRPRKCMFRHQNHDSMTSRRKDIHKIDFMTPLSERPQKPRVPFFKPVNKPHGTLVHTVNICFCSIYILKSLKKWVSINIHRGARGAPNLLDYYDHTRTWAY